MTAKNIRAIGQETYYVLHSAEGTRNSSGADSYTWRIVDELPHFLGKTLIIEDQPFDNFKDLSDAIFIGSVEAPAEYSHIYYTEINLSPREYRLLSVLFNNLISYMEIPIVDAMLVIFQ
jgi:hypothetical protein